MTNNFDNDLKELEKIAEEDQKNRVDHFSGIYKIDGFKEIEINEKPDLINIFHSKHIKKYDNESIIIEIKHYDRSKTFMPRPDGVRINIIGIKNNQKIFEKTYGWRQKARAGEYDE